MVHLDLRANKDLSEPSIAVEGGWVETIVAIMQMEHRHSFPMTWALDRIQLLAVYGVLQ